MPELPEVETTKRGIEPHILHRTIAAVIVRQSALRWPVPGDLWSKLENRIFRSVARRGKYLLLETGTGAVIVHLGMSGSLRIVPAETPPAKHDHLDIVFDNTTCLRLRDPRRFGAVLWSDDPYSHPLIEPLGPEPLGEGFDAEGLYARSRGRKAPVKSFLMDSRTVAGVGNIYANEALFLAGIHPKRAAGGISKKGYELLADAIRAVLNAAIQQGGTTLRDFVNEAGRPGYFRQALNVYGREGESCRRCGSPIRAARLGQRSAYFCPECQRG